MSEMSLSSGEWKLMKLMWTKSPRLIGEMVKELADDTAWSRTTIFVMLKRLITKGAVRMDDSGRLQQYYPMIDRDKASCDETESFLSKVYDGSIGLMVSHMTEKNALTSEEINELRRILDEAERNVEGK